MKNMIIFAVMAIMTLVLASGAFAEKTGNCVCDPCGCQECKC